MKLFDKMKIGTPACGVVGCVAGIVLALLLIFLGFWKTLFICLLGAVENKPEFWKKVINKVLPQKEN